VNYITCPQSSN